MASAPEELVVTDADQGARLDRFLLKAVDGATPQLIEQWLAAGAIRIRGKVPKPMRRLYRGDVVTLERPQPRARPAPSAKGPALPVLHESAAVVVVNKPAGLAVEPAGQMANVVDALAAQLGGFDVAGEARPGVVHRLDKETSGCLMLARTDAAVAALKRAFDEGQIEKTYLVCVLGEAAPKGQLDTAYGRAPDDPRRYTTHVRTARRARLSWKTLRVREGCSVLEVNLDTGRTHQIRVQLAESGLPVLGDRFYGPREAREHPAAPNRQALHALRLAFPDPATGQRVAVTAPIPDDLGKLLERLHP